MKYMLMVLADEKAEQALAPAEWDKVMAQHMALAGELAKAGKLLSGEALQPTHTATTVRRHAGQPQLLITDGPFAETKEQFGGFYVVECADLDEALTLAKRLAAFSPLVDTSVEVRPVMNTDAS
jgi:hypothetical protein